MFLYRCLQEAEHRPVQLVGIGVGAVVTTTARPPVTPPMKTVTVIVLSTIAMVDMNRGTVTIL